MVFPGLDNIVSYSGLESILLVFPGLDIIVSYSVSILCSLGLTV